MELLKYTDLLAAILNMGILIAITAMARRHGLWRSPIAIAVMSYFALRVLSRLNDAPDVFFRDHAELELVLDVLSVLVLAYLLSQAGSIGRLLQAMFDEARYRAEEYDRAQRHYTQVVRHRVLNPVTIIKGAAQTLKADVVRDDAIRDQLCDAIMSAADEIEHVSLQPERRDGLEHELDAVPRLDRRSTP